MPKSLLLLNVSSSRLSQPSRLTFSSEPPFSASPSTASVLRFAQFSALREATFVPLMSRVSIYGLPSMSTLSRLSEPLASMLVTLLSLPSVSCVTCELVMLTFSIFVACDKSTSVTEVFSSFIPSTSRPSRLSIFVS